MKFNDELTLLLKARYPVILINTIEEDRVEYTIRKHIKTKLNRSVYSWDFVDGYTNNPNNEGFAKRNPLQGLELIERLTAETPAIFLLKDFNRFLNDISVSRKLKNIHNTSDTIWKPDRRDKPFSKLRSATIWSSCQHNPMSRDCERAAV